MPRLPVLRPQLPGADRLLPYLRRIDATRTYSNWGPLAGELESRLALHFGGTGIYVVSAASGTSALIGAVLASVGRARTERPVAIVPAFTFVATAVAVESCGYRLRLVDVDPATWSIDLSTLASRVPLDDVGLVVAVAPFGRAVRTDEALLFRERTGIPVVIDGGASIEAIERDPNAHLAMTPVALSLHATKSFAAGEGGCVITRDAALAAQVAQALNFGFHGRRISMSASINGKMSEYHAAVALAELDDWPAKRERFADVARRYSAGARRAQLLDRLIVAPGIASCYVLLRSTGTRETSHIQRALEASDIETRLWYGAGLHEHPHFLNAAHDDLAGTSNLAARLIGLPVAVDLDDEAIDRVITTIRASVDAA